MGYTPACRGVFFPYLPPSAEGFVESDKVGSCPGLTLCQFGFDGQLRPLGVQDGQKIRQSALVSLASKVSRVFGRALGFP